MGTGEPKRRVMACAGIVLVLFACGGASVKSRAATSIQEPCEVSCVRVENGCAAQTESMCFLYGRAEAFCADPQTCVRLAGPCRDACVGKAEDRGTPLEHCEKSCARWQQACAQHVDLMEQAYPEEDPCNPGICPSDGPTANPSSACVLCQQVRALMHAKHEAQRGDARGYCAEVTSSCRSFCTSPQARASTLWKELGYPRARPRAQP
jgi:hypothetical protein